MPSSWVETQRDGLTFDAIRHAGNHACVNADEHTGRANIDLPPHRVSWLYHQRVLSLC